MLSDMNIILPAPRGTAATPAITGRFVFRGPGGTILSDGDHAPLAPGTVETLETRLAEAFRDGHPNSLVGGALLAHLT